MKLSNIIFTTTIILLPSLYFGIVGKPTEMGLSIVAGCLICAFCNIDKFEKFKGAGFEAELRRTVEEAQITIEEMRKIMKPLILFSYHQLTHSGRWGSGREKKDNLTQNLVATIQTLSIQDDMDIKHAKEEYYRYKCWDLYNEFISHIMQDESNPNFRPGELERKVYDELNKLRNYSTNNFPNKEDIHKVLESFNFEINQSCKDKLNKYIDYTSEYNNHKD